MLFTLLAKTQSLPIYVSLPVTYPYALHDQIEAHIEPGRGARMLLLDSETIDDLITDASAPVAQARTIHLDETPDVYIENPTFQAEIDAKISGSHPELSEDLAISEARIHHDDHGNDHVDYGAYTGNHGAFGWYSNHPVGYHRR